MINKSAISEEILEAIHHTDQFREIMNDNESHKNSIEKLLQLERKIKIFKVSTMIN